MKNNHEFGLIPAGAHVGLPIINKKGVRPDKASREQSKQNQEVILGFAVLPLTMYLKSRLTLQQFTEDCSKADLEGWVPADHAYSKAIREEIFGPSAIRRFFYKNSSASSQAIKERLLPAERNTLDAQIHDVIEAVAAMRRYENNRRNGSDAVGLKQLEMSIQKATELLDVIFPQGSNANTVQERDDTIRMLGALLLTRASIARVQNRISDFDNVIHSVLQDAQKKGLLKGYDDAQKILVHAYLYGFHPTQQQQRYLELALRQSNFIANGISENPPSPVLGVEEKVIDAE